MSVSSFVSSLLPDIERQMLNKDITRLRSELNEEIIPLYTSIAEMMQKWEFKDSFTVSMDKMFSNRVKSRFKGNYIEVTKEIMKRSLENLVSIEKDINRSVSTDIVRSTITYGRAQILQLLEAYEFNIRYSRLLMIYTLAVEATLMAKDRQSNVDLTNAQRTWLKDNADRYIRLMTAVDATPKEIDTALRGIPDATVDIDGTSGVEAVVGASKLDPLKLAIHASSLNPIYHIRMAWEDWMYDRTELAKEERQLLEYQLMDLTNRKEGRSDAKVDKAIAYTQSRIDKLNFKLKKMENR